MRKLLTLLALLLLASPAMAAEWFILTFNAPSPQAASYVGQRGNATTPWTEAKLYRSSANLAAPVVPRAPGQSETLLVSVTANVNDPLGYKNGGTVLRWRAVRSNGSVSPWSKYTIVAAAMPIGTFCDGAGSGGCKPTVSGRIQLIRSGADTLLAVAPSGIGPLATQPPPPPPPPLPYVVHFEYTVPAFDNAGTCKNPVNVPPSTPDAMVVRLVQRYEYYAFANQVFALKDTVWQRRGDHIVLDVPVATDNFYWRVGTETLKPGGIRQVCPIEWKPARAQPR